MALLDRKYLGEPVLYRTKCIDTSNTVFLNHKWYPVLDFTITKLLIQFNNGSANWYSKNRFVGYYKDK